MSLLCDLLNIVYEISRHMAHRSKGFSQAKSHKCIFNTWPMRLACIPLYLPCSYAFILLRFKMNFANPWGVRLSFFESGFGVSFNCNWVVAEQNEGHEPLHEPRWCSIVCFAKHVVNWSLSLSLFFFHVLCLLLLSPFLCMIYALCLILSALFPLQFFISS